MVIIVRRGQVSDFLYLFLSNPALVCMLATAISNAYAQVAGSAAAGTALVATSTLFAACPCAPPPPNYFVRPGQARFLFD